MASYPSALITYTNPAGTSILASGPDHAADHTSIHGEIIAIETASGTHSGTNVLKNFIAGDLVARVNNEAMGSPTITGGTIKNVQLIGTSQLTGGTLASAAIGTPTIIGGTVAINGTTVPLSIGAALVPTAGSLVDTAGTTHTVNAQAAQIYYSVMGTAAGNRTIGTPLNPTAWQSLSFYFKASGSTNGTLVWSSAFQISQDIGTATLGTGTSWNAYGYRYNPVSTKWDYLGASKNLI